MLVQYASNCAVFSKVLKKVSKPDSRRAREGTMMIQCSVDLAASIEPRSQSDEIGYYLAHVQMSNELETKKNQFSS